MSNTWKIIHLPMHIGLQRRRMLNAVASVMADGMEWKQLYVVICELEVGPSGPWLKIVMHRSMV
jgi:hypothetical protein